MTPESTIALEKLSVELSVKMDDPVVEAKLDGGIFSSAERLNYLEKAYGFVFSLLSSIHSDSEIVKTFPYIFTVKKAKEVDVTFETPVSVYYKKISLSPLDPTKIIEALQTGNKKNFYVTLGNKFMTYSEGKDVTDSDDTLVVTKTMKPDFEKVVDLEQYLRDIVVAVAAKEAASDDHNMDRFATLSQDIKMWLDVEMLKAREQKAANNG